MDTDVLIVGAGPTGLMLANQLARRGVRHVIIDRNAAPSVASKALATQSRTLEIYSHLDLAQRAIELGQHATGGNVWANGKRVARIALSDSGQGVTPYPYVLIIGQDDNERILGENLRALGGSIQWSTELLTLNQRADSVVASFKPPDGGTRTITAAYVAGCDGARSVVRESCGITFPGAPYEHVFFVADAEMTGTMVPSEVNVYLFRDGFHLLFPMRGENHWRIAGILPPALRNQPDLRFEAVIPTLRNDASSGFNIKSCTWFSTYRIHHRAASRFRDRRCFLCGDAAHVHSPVGGQGMNTGLQDAYNLAWKLALVVQQRSGAQLLDSYEAERIPVARALLNGTDRAFRLVVNTSWLAGLFRTKVLARVAAFAVNRPAAQRIGFRTVSQTGIRYPHSFLSKSTGALPPNAPQAGDRFPWLRLKLAAGGPVDDLFQKLSDKQFHLVLFGQSAPSDAPSDFGDLLQVHAIPTDPGNDTELARVHIAQPSFYLVRPDGYIALCGQRFDAAALHSYVSADLHLMPPPQRAMAAS